MAAKARKTPTGNEPRLPTLQTTRAEAQTRIREQIEKGRQFLQLQITNDEQLSEATAQRSKWTDYYRDLMRRIVDTEDLARSLTPGVVLLGGRLSLQGRIQLFYSDTQDRLNRLESVLGRLDLIPESSEIAGPSRSSASVSRQPSRKVFIVHGHDEEAKHAVARLIEKLGLEAVILHEQPNEGRTIIEKFEDYSDVGFAVVLLTPDDVGASISHRDNLNERARQNVILELGFFIGKLGRSRVCALHKGNLELPADYSGVLWLQMDPVGGWHLQLAKEMKGAGLDIDVNKLL